MHTALTFSQTPPSFRTRFEEIYNMRKCFTPSFDRYGMEVEWCDRPAELTCPDKSVDQIHTMPKNGT